MVKIVQLHETQIDWQSSIISRLFTTLRFVDSVYHKLIHWCSQCQCNSDILSRSSMPFVKKGRQHDCSSGQLQSLRLAQWQGPAGRA